MTQSEIQQLINEQESLILGNEAELRNEDYKVIKCAEAKVKDLPMPYDTDELIARRNGYRQAINDAQAEIERLSNQYHFKEN